MSDRHVRAYALPSWALEPSHLRSAPVGSGLEIHCPDRDAAWMAELAAGLRSLSTRRGGSAATVQGDTDAVRRARSLGAVGRRFLDPDDELRRDALALLPQTSGLSGAMSEVVLDGMAADWVPERLVRLLTEELGDPSPLDRFVDRGDRSVMAVAPRLCVQLVAGSVPGVGVSALLRSLLLGAPTLLKPGLGDVVLPVLFAQALAEEDPALAARLAVVYWPGGETDMEDAALSPADVAVVYGSDRTVASVEARVRAGTRFVGYHHREGVGVVGAGVLGSAPVAARCASDVARAVALFDQRGCVSPRVVYVEAAPVAPLATGPAAFARLLAVAFERLEADLPSGSLDRTERSGVHQLRGTAEMLSAGLEGGPADTWVAHGGAAPWTVVYDPDRALETSCVGRTVVVRPFRGLEDLIAMLEPAGPHLQTVGVAGLGDRMLEVAAWVGRIGASRVTSFASVPFPSPWWHHDGRGPLSDLVRWTDLERSGEPGDAS